MAEVKIDVKIVNAAALSELAKLDRRSTIATESIKKFGTEGSRAVKAVGDQARKFDLSKRIFQGVLAVDIFRKSLSVLRNVVVDAVREFAELETAAIGVEKTTGITGDQLGNLVSNFQELSTQIPVSAKELLNLAQAAGQLGVEGDANILKFTETVARLGFATDVSGEDAAKALARILNVTKESVSTVDTLASVIVDLGNNFEATESEIITVANEVARSTAVFGVSSGEAVALGAALKSLGIQAEGGGTAVGKAFRQISLAIANGGEQLEDFAKITGLTVDQLRTRFAEDATEVFKLFIKGLKDSGLSAGELTKQLGILGLGQDRTAKVLPPLINGYEKLSEALERQSAQTKNATALEEESERAFKSLNSEYEKTINSISRLGSNFLSVLAPALRTILTEVRIVTDFWGEAFDPNPVRETQREIRQFEARIVSLNKKINDPRAKGSPALAGLKAELVRTEADLKKLNDRLEEFKKKQQSPEEDKGGPSPKKAQDPLELKRIENLKKTNEEIALINEEKRLLEEEQARINADNLLNIEEVTEKRRIELKQQAVKKIITDEKAQAEELRKLQLQEAKRGLKEQENADKQRLSNRKSTLNSIATLQGSSNKTLAAIGKAAALTQIAIDGPQAVTKALAAFPPPFNFIAAASVGAAVAAQAAKVVGVKFEQGGIVGGNSFTGDQVQARVNSGEMILNRQQQTQLFAMANGQGGGSGQEVVVNTTVELDGETVARAVSRQVANGFELGEQV